VSALNRRLRGIERRCADPPVMMPTLCVHFYASVVSCGSVLECDALALDHTCVSVRRKKVAVDEHKCA
jgi:hypothetical protein